MRTVAECAHCRGPIPAGAPAGVCPACLFRRAMVPALPADRTGGLVPDTVHGPLAHYELLEEIGRGGMGIVYKARQIPAERVVALKVIRWTGRDDDEQLRRFRTEARSLARIRHPHIVQIFEVGDADMCPYFSMEYVEGDNLAIRLRRNGPLPPVEAARLAELLALAIQAAHRAGVLHRDLKPSNILMSGDGTPKVTDFGLAMWLDAPDRVTASGVLLGTPSYMAPEQAGRPDEVGVRTDVYAIGATLYEMLTGRPPHRAETSMATAMLVVHAPIVPPGKLCPRLPAALEAICLKCLARTPADRYPTAAALAHELRLWLSDQTLMSARAGRRWTQLRRVSIVASLAAVLSFVPEVPGGTRNHPEAAADSHNHQRAATGGSATLVGPTGFPAYRRWATGDAQLGLSETGDRTVGFQTRLNSLLELAPNPAHDRFRVTADIRQLRAWGGGVVGLYAGYALVPAPNGTAAHQALTITFNDAGSLDVKRQLQGQVAVLFHQPGSVLIPRSRNLNGAFALPGRREQTGAWRTLVADIGPDGVSVRWRSDDGTLVDAVAWTADDINERMTALATELDNKERLELPLQAWNPRGPLGIFARDAAVSVRNVSLEPLPLDPAPKRNNEWPRLFKSAPR